MFSRLLFQSFRRRPTSALTSHLTIPRFSTSIPRNEYTRFRDHDRPHKQPRNVYDPRDWDPRVKLATALALGGGLYYVSQ